MSAARQRGKTTKKAPQYPQLDVFGTTVDAAPRVIVAQAADDDTSCDAADLPQQPRGDGTWGTLLCEKTGECAAHSTPHATQHTAHSTQHAARNTTHECRHGETGGLL